jgi:hypothetical protein
MNKVFFDELKIPDLDKVKTSDAEQFNIRCSRRFKEMELYKGRIVNLDRRGLERTSTLPGISV